MATIDHPRAAGLLKTASFSQVVTTSRTRTIYVSGQVSLDEEGDLVGGGDLASQTVQAMRNLGLALALPEWRIEIEAVAMSD